MDVIPVIDLRLLTQAEINTLALSSTTFSSSTRNFSNNEETLVTKIDRSVFNESAGSRKQTYSRLCLAPPKSNPSTSTGRRRGRPRSLVVLSSTSPSSAPDVSSPSTAPDTAADELGWKENNQIVHFLRMLLAKNGHSETLDIFNPRPSHVPDFLLNPLPPTISKPDDDAHKKRSMKKKRIREEGVGGDIKDTEIMNAKGVAIDLVQLGKKEDLFRVELAKRTAGLVKEAEFLRFLDGLEGEWGSRRKRRKIVDSECLGEDLPKGWRLLLGLKRKDGAVWINCRRYISPSGKQFTSCKEVSSFLLSLVGSQDVKNTFSVIQEEGTIIQEEGTIIQEEGTIIQEEGTIIQEEGTIVNGKFTIGSDAASNEKNTASCFSGGTPISVYSESRKQIIVSKENNSPKNQILNLLKCLQCDIKFPDKDSHVQHLLKFHQRNPKKNGIGKSITSGVIITDGKYECQFCHKVFVERHRYNGHVGIHVRKYSESLDSLADYVIVNEGSEVNAAWSSENENLVKDSCSFDLIFEVNRNSHEGKVCIPNNTVADSLIDATCSKSADEMANNDYTNEKMGNYIENSNLENFEHNVATDIDSYAKEINHVSICEPIKKKTPGSNLECPTKSTVDEFICVTNDKQKEHTSPQCMSETPVKELGDANVIIGENFERPFNVIYSDIVCDSKCGVDETNDSKTEVLTDHCNRTLDENSICIAETDKTDIIGNIHFDKTAVIAESAKENYNMHGNIHLDSSCKTDGTVLSINEPNNIHFDIHTNGGDNSHCNSKFSTKKEDLHSQYEKSCSTQRSGENIKQVVPLHVDSSSVFSGTVPCETSFGQNDVLAQNGLLAELYFENNLSMPPPCSSVQPYNAKTSVNNIMKSNSTEDHEFIESSNYCIQNCVVMSPSDVSQECDLEKPVAYQIGGSSDELGIDLEFGLSGSNIESVMSSNEVVGCSSVLDVGLHNAPTPSLWSKPTSCPIATGMVSNQNMSKFHAISSNKVDKYQSSADIGEVRLDKFGLSDSLILDNETVELRTESAMDLSSYNSGELGDAYVAPVELAGGLEDMGNDNSRDGDITTVCMWCGVGYNNQQIIINIQQPLSGAIGFICLKCKSKMYGQLKF